MPERRGYDAIKRAMDVAVASVVLLLTAPVQAVVALAVRRRLGAGVLFRQPRPGRDEKVFELVKFRSMSHAEPGSEQGDAVRLSPFGLWLRSTSLDELPTLWNVLRGDMSLVGPRPLLVEYLPRYSARQRRRHEVRPGMTGLAQVAGRNALSWEEKFELDVTYVESRSLLLDLRILARTVGLVVRRHGISDSTGPTMAVFTGSGDAPGTGDQIDGSSAPVRRHTPISGKRA